MKFPFLLAALLTACSAVPAWAGDIYVITNKSTVLTAAEVRDVYLGNKTMAGGTLLLPVDNGALQKEFLDKVLHVDGAKYGRLWVNKSFRDGSNPPDVKSGDAEVTAIVRATSGAIGYVSTLPANVTLISKF